MAAPRIDDIWRFWDYGSIQFVENRVTGEFLKVHGPDALFGDGPFKMVRDAAEGGRPILLGLDGTDLERALHLADEHASLRLRFNCGEEPGDESIVSIDTDERAEIVTTQRVEGVSRCTGDGHCGGRLPAIQGRVDLV